MKHWLSGLVDALMHPINPSVVILLGLYTILWGVWVGNPFWTVFPLSSLYDALAAVWFFGLPAEFFWGATAVITGAITTWGAIKRQFRPLTWGAGACFTFWFVVSLFYFIGDWHSTGGITAGLIWVYCAYIYLNIRVNFKLHREPHDLFHECGHHCAECGEM